MNRVSDMANRLKDYRIRYSYTLADMEKLTAVPAQTLNRYELGQRIPKIDVAIQIAEALHVNPLWMMGYDVPEEMKEPIFPREDEPKSQVQRHLLDAIEQMDDETAKAVLDLIKSVKQLRENGSA